ncbi:MAG: succinate dehydrogenase cytochrome b subunit [Microscillaceae bacterium]
MSANPTEVKQKPNWLIEMLGSTIGRKLMMALTGLFLILFLVVHLAGNLQLLIPDEGRTFNEYAEFMGHNKLIQIVSILNFAFIILHIIVSIILTRYNRKARPVAYAYNRSGANSSWASRNMIWLGMILLIFLVLHLINFWAKSKFGPIEEVVYEGRTYHDLYAIVKMEFANPLIVGVYVLAMAGLAYHLLHGFQSAFQTFGVNHVKYTPIIKSVGLVFSILVPLLFAAIPIVMYIQSLL